MKRFCSRLIFKTVKTLVRLFYGKTNLYGTEHLPSENTVIVANHCQMNGPIVGELFLPETCYIWCAGEMMHLKEVPAYAFRDFWSQKPKWTHPFYRILSYLIAPLSACVFSNARTVAVYHDNRTLSTFKESIRHLSEGHTLLIFPEKDEKFNHILYRFQENFIDVAKLYYKKSGVPLSFVPMYIAPKLRGAYFGTPITFDPSANIEDERRRISSYLVEEITKIARDLPRHTVVPYRNIKKSHYLTNQDVTEVPR